LHSDNTLVERKDQPEKPAKLACWGQSLALDASRGRVAGDGQRHRNCRTAGPQNCNRLQATPETRHPQLIHWNVPNTFWTFASLPVLWVTEDMSSCVNLHQKRCGGWSASGSGQAWICSELGLSEAFDLEQGLGNRLDSLIRHIRRKYLREAAFLLFRIEWPA
jgi:hypothetical protein